MKFNFSTLKSLITFVVFFMFLSCGNNPLDIDVSNVKVDLKVKRFDNDLFEAKQPFNETNLKGLNDNYGEFFNSFTNNIINIGNIKSEEAQYHLNAFVNDPYIKEIKEKSSQLYGDFSTYKVELEDAFKHYKHYFPKKSIPEM